MKSIKKVKNSLIGIDKFDNIFLLDGNGVWKQLDNKKIMDAISSMSNIIEGLKEENKFLLAHIQKLKTEIECNNEVIEQLTINK